MDHPSSQSEDIVPFGLPSTSSNLRIEQSRVLVQGLLIEFSSQMKKLG